MMSPKVSEIPETAVEVEIASSVINKKAAAKSEMIF